MYPIKNLPAAWACCSTAQLP